MRRITYNQQATMLLRAASKFESNKMSSNLGREIYLEAIEYGRQLRSQERIKLKSIVRQS